MAIHKISDLDVNEKYFDSGFKMSEIKKYEQSYPGIKIIKEPRYYKSDEQVKDDWITFSSLPQHLRIIADEKCLFLFGKTNQEMYDYNKSFFQKKDIDTHNPVTDCYRPAKLREEFFPTKEPDYIINPNIDNLEQLDYSWSVFQQQPEDEMEIANSISLYKYGKTVPEIYDELSRKLRSNQHNPEDVQTYIDSIYSPPNTIEEAVSCIFDKAVDRNTSLIEEMIYEHRIMARANHNTKDLFHKAIIENIEEDINKRILKENTFNIFDANYFLPQEIVSIFGDEDKLLEDELYINYSSRFYGFKPIKEHFANQTSLSLTNKNVTEETQIKLGWNPIIEYNEENRKISKNRALNIFNENNRFVFIPFTESLEVNYNVENKDRKGITIITFNECDRSNAVPDGISRILINFNINENGYFPLIYGKIGIKTTLHEVKSYYKDPLINCYFLEVNDNSINFKELITAYNLNEENSFINTISRLGPTPDLEDSKVFVINFLENFLNTRNVENKYTIYHVLETDNCKNQKDIINAINKISIIEDYDKYVNSNILKNSLKITPFNESNSLPLEFDDDGNMFIKRKNTLNFAIEYSNCHKLLKQYEKGKNYEGIKYNLAKLWYMNLLIEEKIYRKNKNELLLQELPDLYKVRAHILSDFNIYFSIILKEEPDFNFELYYKTTPFDRSVLKISKNFLSKMWDYIKALIVF